MGKIFRTTCGLLVGVFAQTSAVELAWSQGLRNECPPVHCDPCPPGSIPHPRPSPSQDLPQTDRPVPQDLESQQPPAPITSANETTSDVNESAESVPPTNNFSTNRSATRTFGSGLSTGSGGVDNNAPSYIDDASVRSRFRLRYDSVDGGDSDRAEFLYGTYSLPALGLANPAVDGPALIAPRRIDYEEINAYFEVLLTPNVSAFVELGVRWNDVDSLENLALGDLSASGLGDMNAGVKLSLLRSVDHDFTFQFRTIIPTGEAQDLMGTGHVSLMPGLLYKERLTKRLTVFGELHDWIAVGATEIGGNDPNAGEHFGGNVLKYGAGMGYDLCQTRNRRNSTRLTWLNEFVGWTVLQGYSITPMDQATFNNTIVLGDNPPVRDASGDTIVNLKTGVRWSHGLDNLYVGYGFAMTEDVWYDDIIRVQWERFF